MLFDVRTEPRTGWVEVTVLGELRPRHRSRVPRASSGGRHRRGGPRRRRHVGASAFIDSVGLGLLVGAARRARAAGGSLIVVAPTDRSATLLAETGLDRVLDIRPSYEPDPIR